MSPEEVVVAYHERTKHHFQRFARGPGELDWANQPDPFRRYRGAALVRLPLPDATHARPYWQLYVADSTPPAPLSVDSLSRLFRYALSLTAWKRFRDVSWSLRANPSSGNLHPTEGYAIVPALEGLHDRPALHHYAPKEHGLERRAEFEGQTWSALMRGFPEGSFLIGLSSIHWREAWKYGERAYRYCQHDVGHALAALRMAAAALGWDLHLLGVSDSQQEELLGLDRADDFAGAEREHPDLMAIVTLPPTQQALFGALPPHQVAHAFFGQANSLSAGHVDWPAIDDVAQATRCEQPLLAAEELAGFPDRSVLFSRPVRSSRFSVDQVILGRRSAVGMDGVTTISEQTFYEMLSRLVPTADGRSVPWDAIPWRPRIQLGLFVHRVQGLQPGLYALLRDPHKFATLRDAMHPEFVWQRPSNSPPGLPLYLLRVGNYESLAAQLSCGQDIAGQGAFSLAMLAEYQDALARYGAPFYRNLFWEAGMVGQVLYLEAEASAVRATGIGCYFDDPVHRAFGITSRAWQSLYHLSIGGAVEDARLTTLPAYGASVP
jgi:SagB-type dehydrogenase family enzyme